jgi:uncharacterized phage infection (PIP) family protein YhgE
MGKGKLSTSQRHCCRYLSSTHGQEHRPSSEIRKWNFNGVIVFQENLYTYYAISTRVQQCKAFIANIDQCNSNTTCLDAHNVPEEEYLVDNAPTLNNQETTPENGTELMVETPESHLILQSLPGFDWLKHFTTSIEQRNSNIACFRDESLAKHVELSEIIQDQNPSATNSTTNTPENDRKPTFTNMPENSTKLAENSTKPTLETTGPLLIKTLQQFEDGLPQNNSQQEESKTFKQGADGLSKNVSQQEESQLDNPTHELVQQHYKFQHPQWMAKSGILPPCLATCRAPQCVACYNDKASRLTWQEKGSARKIAVDPLTMMWQFEDGLPHNNSQQEESLLDNLTPKLLQQYQKLSHEFEQWMFKRGILPKPPGCMQSTQVRIWLQWQSLTATMARKGGWI